MTFITSSDAAFSQATEATLAIPFKPLSTDASKLDETSVPQEFSIDLARLLWNIKRAGVPLTGKIAQYAGFYLDGTETIWDPTTDNGSAPDDNTLPLPTNKQRNKSLDKLTFLIMFVLPFRMKALEKYYGDPLDTSATTWSSLANKLRVSPLIKLNMRGEQVNTQGLGDEYDTAAAFKHYGLESAITGTIGDEVKKKPLYVYLNLSTESPFSDSSRTRSVIHQPENILGLMDKRSPAPVFKKRFVQSGTYIGITPFAPFVPHFPTTPADYDSQIIEQEPASGRYYVVSKTNPVDKLYLERLLLDENLSDEVFELKGLRLTPAGVSNTSWFIASYYSLPSRKDDTTWSDRFGFDNGLPGVRGYVQFEKIALEGHSSMTMAWGLDMGRWWPSHYYNINFKVLINKNHAAQTPTVTDFALWYRGTRISDPLSFTVSATSATAVKTALLKLLELNEKAWNYKYANPKNPDTIVVDPIFNSGDPDPAYNTGYDVTIRRISMERPVAEYYNIYAGNIFYHAEQAGEAKANVKLVPEVEKDRFVANPEAVTAWNEFDGLMTKLFGGQAWLHPSNFEELTPGHETEEVARFGELMKRSIGIQRGPAFVLIRNNLALLKKFRLPKIVELYPRFVKEFVLPQYYDPIYAAVPADLKPRLNVAEKYVLLAYAYQGGAGSHPLINLAIKTKNVDLLIEAVNGFKYSDSTRKERIVTKLNDYFRRELYRNVEVT